MAMTFATIVDVIRQPGLQVACTKTRISRSGLMNATETIYRGWEMSLNRERNLHIFLFFRLCGHPMKIFSNTSEAIIHVLTRSPNMKRDLLNCRSVPRSCLIFQTVVQDQTISAHSE